jgi:hypothetical protein
VVITLDKIQRSNYVREQIRNSFISSNIFIFEHLADGFCNVTIEFAGRKARLTFNGADGVKDTIDKLNNKLDVPFNVMFDTLESCGIHTTNNKIVEPEYKPIDGKVALTNFEAFSSLFSDDEVAESNNLIKMTRANRVWLLENKKILLNTAQNKMFHKLANEARLASPVDVDKAILEAFELAAKE